MTPEVEQTERDGAAVRFAREHAALLASVAASVLLWLPPITSSLWLDETGTFWVIKDGAATAVERSVQFQGQSPVFFLIERGVRNVFGSSEIVMRLPSFFSMVIAAAFVYLLGSRLVDRKAGLLAAVAFGSAESVAFLAVDARPYALALALSVAATLVFHRLVEEPSGQRQLLYVLTSALMVYVNFLFALTFVAHAGYVLARKRVQPVAAGRLVLAWIFIGALCAPLAGQILSLWGRSESLSWVSRPTAGKLLATIILPMGVIAAGKRFERASPAHVPRIGSGLILLAAWALVPVVVTLAVSLLTSAHVFDTKYYISAAPGIALLFGWALRSLPSASFRIGAAALLVVAAGVTFDSSHTDERWRDAVRTINSLAGPGTPVLMNTGFIEARSIPWVTDSSKRGFLLAPFARYPLEGRPVLIPYGSERRHVDLAVAAASAESRASDHILLVTNYVDPFTAPIARALEPRGFTGRIVGSFGTILIAEYRRG